jgi:hypothetical protein
LEGSESFGLNLGEFTPGKGVIAFGFLVRVWHLNCVTLPWIRKKNNGRQT